MEEEENKQMMMRVIIQEVDIRKEEEIDQIIIIEEWKFSYDIINIIVHRFIKKKHKTHLEPKKSFNLS